LTDFKDYMIELPPIDDTCKDGKCEHVHKVKVSNKPPQPKIESITAPAPTVSEEKHDHSHDLEVNHNQLAEIMPGGTNFAKCADGSCGNSVIQNSKLTKKFKKCTNCDSNAVPKKNDFCPTCGNKPEDAEEWDDSEIDSEKIGEDEE